MTWIFAEDFEGITEATEAVNLRRINLFYLVNNRIAFHDGAGEEAEDTEVSTFYFNAPEQAQAAYEKIKGMLKPPLTMQQVYAYEPVSKKITFPAGQ